MAHPPVFTRIVVAFGLVSLAALAPSPGRAAGTPAVLFVPGFCSAATGFTELMRHLPDRRFGAAATIVSFDADGTMQAPDSRPDAITFAMDYRAPQGQASASRIGMRDKAGELKRVVDFVKARTGAARVILVGHGMGGLVARAYVQGFGLNIDGNAIAYDGDVAGLVAIDTPHRGLAAGAAAEDWDPACASADSTNWREMQAGVEGSLIEALNRTPWPAGTRLDAIASYYSEREALDTDGVVLRASQDAREISSYWASHAEVRAWAQPLASRRIAGFPALSAHSAVIRTPTTAALVASLVDELDARLAAVAGPAVTDGLPESPHDYSDNVDSSWSFTLPGNPSSIDVTFDPRTNVEEDYDYVYVMDGAGNNVAGSPFTGDMLAGRTLRVSGATVRIRLTSDYSVTRFGFKLIEVVASAGNVPTSRLPESAHPYANDYHGGWFYTADGNPGAIDVTFDAQTKVEDGYDYIHVTDADGRAMGDSPYTGTELAGRTVRVQGASVRVILETDDSITDWGYKVTRVAAVGGSTASIATQGASATTETTSTGVTYRTQVNVCETGGRSALNISSIRVNLRNSTRTGGATFTDFAPIAAGACQLYRLNVNSTNATDLYTSVSFVISYSDATGTQASYTTPASTAITPPTSTTPPPATGGGSRFDGTYNLFVRRPVPGGGADSSNQPGYLTIRGTTITSRDGWLRGTVDLQFGTVRMTSECLNGSLGGATWEGTMNQSAQAGSNFGQGTWDCAQRTGAPVANRSWQATQSR